MQTDNVCFHWISICDLSVCFVYVYSHVNSTILINSNVCGVRGEEDGWGREDETAGLERIVCRGMS